MSSATQRKSTSPFAAPAVGSMLTIASGLSFLSLCMILPLVGRSGSVAPHAKQNALAFLGMLTVSLALGVLAVWSKLVRRRIDNSPLPFFSLGLCALCVMLLLAFLLGLLKL